MSSSTQRTVVITGVGAERGIGRATAHRFARDGWAVAGLDLDGDASAKLAAELTERYGVPAYGGPVNVADEASVLAARDAVHAADLPTVGAVLNIAGITSPVPFLETTLDLWNKIFAVNATGTYLVTKAFLPDMIDGGYGRIVNMSSVSAQQGGGVFGKTPYSSAKAAVIGFTRSLARELGPTGITVNAIAAGAVDTDIRVQGTSPELEASIVAERPTRSAGLGGRRHRAVRVPGLGRGGLHHRHHPEPQRRLLHRLTRPHPTQHDSSYQSLPTLLDEGIRNDADS